jgi:hypothetical protein
VAKLGIQPIIFLSTLPDQPHFGACAGILPNTLRSADRLESPSVLSAATFDNSGGLPCQNIEEAKIIFRRSKAWFGRPECPSEDRPADLPNRP